MAGKSALSETIAFQKGRNAECLIQNKEEREFESCNNAQNGGMHLCKKLHFAEENKPGKAWCRRLCAYGIFSVRDMWRRVRDSNPCELSLERFSRPAGQNPLGWFWRKMRPDGEGRKSQCLQGFRGLWRLKTAEILEYRFCQIQTWSKGFLRANLRNPLDQRCFLQFFAPNCRYKVDGRLYPNAHSISNPGEVCFSMDISPHRECTPIRWILQSQSDSW